MGMVNKTILLVLALFLALAPASADETYITESYLRRKIECNTLAHLIGDIMADLLGGGWFNHPNCDDWHSHGQIKVIIDSSDHGMYEVALMEISARSYQPGGKVLRSPPQDLDEGVVTTGEYSSIRNHGDEPLEHAVDKTVSLEQSQTSELSAGITLDLTSKESASYGGVSADLEQHLGITVNKSESQTSSKTVTTTFSDKVTIDPGEEVAIVYKKTDKRYSQDYSIDALIDVAFCLWLGHHPHQGTKSHYLFSGENDDLWEKHHEKMCFKSIHDFVGFLLGYDVRAPGMAGYDGHMNDRAKRALGVLQHNTHNMLSLVLSGTDYIVHDDDADYSIEDISGMTDDDVKNRFGEEGKDIGG